MLRAFLARDLDGQRLVYAATGDRVLDAVPCRMPPRRAAFRSTSSMRRSSPPSSRPAIVDRAPVTVAIGTEGAAPVLAREIKTRLEAVLPANLGALAERAKRCARVVAKSHSRCPRPPPALGAAAAGPVPPRRSRAAQEAEAGAHPRRRAPWRGSPAPASGRVALIGCGPGDPDLLTLKALQTLQEADVLVVDRLVNPRILEYARRDAERIFVGKTPRGPTTSQAEINRILVREASAGKVVARLKGGDPFIFGRAAEEMAALQAAGHRRRGGARRDGRARLRGPHRPARNAARACAASSRS